MTLLPVTIPVLTGDTMTTYLEEAAAELRKAREANERKAADPDRFGVPTRLAEVSAERLRIATCFSELERLALIRAAIEAGLSPCRCHEVPEVTP